MSKADSTSSLRHGLRTAAIVAALAIVGIRVDAEPVSIIRNNGSSANRVDVVILGDGYSAADIASGKYAADVETFVTGMFQQEPHREYQRFFNVRRIDVTSAESGVDHPASGVYRDTALDATYNCSGIQRLICVNQSKVNAVLAASGIAADARDMVIVVVNDGEYGGSGGAVAVASMHPAVVELVLHETGHSFALLADEYGGPPPPSCNASFEPAAVNATKDTNRDSMKWGVWIAASTPLPTSGTADDLPGAYAGAAYCDTELFRPTFNSKMRSLGRPFETINVEQHIRRFYNLVSPIDGWSPSESSVSGQQTFSVSVPQPLTHDLEIVWRVDGAVAGAGPSFDGGAIGAGAHQLQVTVRDPTPAVRAALASVLTATRVWTVSDGSGLTAPAITTHPASQAVIIGQTTTFTVAASGNPAPTYQWQTSTNGGASFTSLTNTAPYSGVATGTLTVAGATIALNGTLYRCVATNSVGSATSNAAMLTVNAASLSATPLDFDGDGKADLTYVHPPTWTWNSLQSSANYTSHTAVQWGLPGDVPVPGDYDGDGIADPAIYRPSNGAWFVTASSLNGRLLFAVSLGFSADIPVPGDYDGDGQTDPAVYRPSTGTWFVRKSSTGYAAPTPIQWGLPGDVPVVGDYDGDGTADPAVYRPASGTWYALTSSTGLAAFATFSLGASTDQPVPGDYDGDGKTDPAVYRPSDRTWRWLTSSAGATAASPLQWGLAGDLPVPADYDGDGRIDPAVYRPSSGTWFVRQSTSTFTTFVALAWGERDDVPLPVIPAATTHSDARRLSDVDGDGKADLTVFRPSSGVWYTRTSSSNYAATQITQWGLPTDTPVPGDYDGDGKADRAVYRPALGVWYVLTSRSAYTAFTVTQWGLSTDVPVPGDYDGDGKTDLAVYRPASGLWYLRTSSSGYTTFQVYQWGLSSDTPVPSDYDGDGKTDLAVYRPATGTWHVRTSSSNYTTSTATQWGLSTDTPVPGDYDGDGLTDFAVYRPASGLWYLRLSRANFTTSQVVQWGLPSDVVVPGDYDGDGKTDLAVFRPATGVWYVLTSSSGYTTFFTRQWGLGTDVPILKR